MRDRAWLGVSEVKTPGSPAVFSICCEKERCGNLLLTESRSDGCKPALTGGAWERSGCMLSSAFSKVPVSATMLFFICPASVYFMGFLSYAWGVFLFQAYLCTDLRLSVCFTWAGGDWCILFTLSSIFRVLNKFKDKQN